MIEGAIAGFIFGVLFTAMLVITISRTDWARRDRSGHLCLHINGAHQCVCRRVRDHSSEHHAMVAELYDDAKEAR